MRTGTPVKRDGLYNGQTTAFRLTPIRSASPTSAVPEPASLTFLLLAAAPRLLTRRRKVIRWLANEIDPSRRVMPTRRINTARGCVAGCPGHRDREGRRWIGPASGGRSVARALDWAWDTLLRPGITVVTASWSRIRAHRQVRHGHAAGGFAGRIHAQQGFDAVGEFHGLFKRDAGEGLADVEVLAVGVVAAMVAGGEVVSRVYLPASRPLASGRRTIRATPFSFGLGEERVDRLLAEDVEDDLQRAAIPLAAGSRGPRPSTRRWRRRP